MSAPVFNVTIDKTTTDFIEQSVRTVLDVKASEYTAELQKKLQPTVIKIDKKQIVADKGKHNKFADVLYKCILHKQAFLAGPTGSGKTMIAQHIAEAMELPFYFISCSAGMSEAHLLGRMLFDGTYAASDFVRAYEGGGVFLFDEIDAADNNTTLVINSALANGKLSVPNRKDKPYAERHPNCIVLVAGNSWGEGSIEFQGRTSLDKAFLDRFAMSKIDVQYDEALEKMITSDEPRLCTAFHEFRKHLKSKSISKAVSTRSIASAYKEIKQGKKIQEIMKEFIIGWSTDEQKHSLDFITKW